ncbi:cupin [Streptomyces sp. NPDC088768]|uniref:cupin n=1 Tax=Streptomyces sp. NPDC088768 TaxID=3365894 RepID=UPI0037FC7A3B
MSEADIHELWGVEWLALGCCPVQVWPDWCPDEDESPGAGPVEKSFCRPTVEHASPITIYSGAECSTIGWSYAEAREQVLATLELGQQRAIEEGFWRETLAPRAVDLTSPAGPVSVAQGVAALEGALAETYGGQGLLHVPTGVAALLGCCQVLQQDAATDCPRTLAGNRAVIGAGYSAANSGPDGAPAAPGTAWLYISGPVEVRLGPVDVVPDRAGPAVNYRVNDLKVLAERTAVAGTTCQVFAINVEACPV